MSRQLIPIFAILFLVSHSFAQVSTAPYQVRKGERVRVVVIEDLQPAHSTYFIGDVINFSADSISLALVNVPARTFQGHEIGWASIIQIERSADNTTGELLGMLIGGSVGGALAYIAADMFSDEPLAKAGFVPGAFVGLFAGGLIGANIGEHWEPIPLHGTRFISVSLPIR